jgi:hypothetical protein
MLEMPQFLNSFMIFKWSDFLEISIFSSFIFYFSLWLKTDSQKKLLPIFYSLSALFIFSDYFQLFTLSNFLFTFSPVFILLFIVLHQNTIQKNFISTKNITPAHLQKLNWVSELVKTLLTATDSKKEIYCLIECNDSLYNFIKPGIFMNTKIQRDILEVLINSKQFNTDKFIWINRDGSIKAINTDWNLPENLILFENEDNERLNHWEKNSIKITSKLDVLTIKSSSDTRTFSIVAQGKILNDIFTDKAINIIDQFIKKNSFKKENREFKTGTVNQQLNN